MDETGDFFHFFGTLVFAAYSGTQVEGIAQPDKAGEEDTDSELYTVHLFERDIERFHCNCLLQTESTQMAESVRQAVLRFVAEAILPEREGTRREATVHYSRKPGG
ncbi:MAG: hypothetical protein ACUVX8_17115 [Candidatus Zipacnadales bacterium]